MTPQDVSTVAELKYLNARQPYVMCDGGMSGHVPHRVPVIVTAVHIVWDGDTAHGRYLVLTPDADAPAGVILAQADPGDLQYALDPIV